MPPPLVCKSRLASSVCYFSAALDSVLAAFFHPPCGQALMRKVSGKLLSLVLAHGKFIYSLDISERRMLLLVLENKKIRNYL